MHYEKEEKLLPTIFLDYKSMLVHDFICKDEEKRLIYNLVFGETTCQIIILPAPSLFNIHSGTYIILPDDISAYWERTRSPEPEPEPSPDHIRSLFISGIRRRSPTSGTQRTLLHTPERAALIRGHRPT